MQNKKINYQLSFITVFVLLLVPFLSVSQSGKVLDKKHVVSGGAFMKVDSLSEKHLSIWPEIYGTYEYNLSRHIGGFFRMNLLVPVKSINIQLEENNLDSIKWSKARGFGLNLGARYYIGDVMEGFYIGPAVSYYRYNHEYMYKNKVNVVEYSVTSVRGSMSLGYQHIFKNNLSVHGYISLVLDHKKYTKFISDINTVPAGESNTLKPDAGFSIGYFFKTK